LVLEKPVKLEKDHFCSISLQFKTGNTHSGTGGSSSVKGERDLVFTFSQCTASTNGTNVNTGQVPEIYYSFNPS